MRNDSHDIPQFGNAEMKWAFMIIFSHAWGLDRGGVLCWAFFPGTF